MSMTETERAMLASTAAKTDAAAALGGVMVDQAYRTTGNAVVVRLA